MTITNIGMEAVEPEDMVPGTKYYIEGKLNLSDDDLIILQNRKQIGTFLGLDKSDSKNYPLFTDITNMDGTKIPGTIHFSRSDTNFYKVNKITIENNVNNRLYRQAYLQAMNKGTGSDHLGKYTSDLFGGKKRKKNKKTYKKSRKSKRIKKTRKMKNGGMLGRITTKITTPIVRRITTDTIEAGIKNSDVYKKTEKDLADLLNTSFESENTNPNIIKSKLPINKALTPIHNSIIDKYR